MCGIVGYLGEQDAEPILVEGLQRLEYRGYDSAGIATIDADGGNHIVRSAGKLANLRKRLSEEPCAGHVGIGHTRWATHGAPNEQNAHPHYTEGITVVQRHHREPHQAA